MPAHAQASTSRGRRRKEAALPSADLRHPVRCGSARIVHIAAECWPFARTGGLGEAVSTLASHHTAGGLSSTVVMPLYRQVKQRRPDLKLVHGEIVISLGDRQECVRVWHADASHGRHDTFFIDHPLFGERDGVYGRDATDYPDNAQRFATFCVAALAALPEIAPRASVVHAHDWHAALVPVYLRTAFAASEFHQRLGAVLSVHNAAFQGTVVPQIMPMLGLSPSLYDWRLLEWYGRVNLLKGGLAFADAVTTVSPTHAWELTTPEGGFGLHDAFAALGERLVGILNGLDDEIWNPSTDIELAARYSASSLSGKHDCKAELQRAFGLPHRAEAPVIAMCARLAAQKGIDVVLESEALSRDGVQLIVLGEGEPGLADALSARAAAASHRIAVRTSFSERLEHVLLGGADLFLMPSRYEPCGLAQMRAQRYGALPVAHRVGGLADTIEDGVTGFLFDGCTPAALDGAIARALVKYADRATWRRMMRGAMSRDFGWSNSAAAYRGVYQQAVDESRRRRPRSLHDAVSSRSSRPRDYEV